ncbi:C45 family autoproteolytic acyltransferase/hydrolase [Rhodococcus qingshengii]|uniref:C45 family autoproteolytic acyltransferase/hydolase n=1 Tax=Rhodococcus qingshengii TaxID=334542 RepID=UPI0036DA4A32
MIVHPFRSPSLDSRERGEHYGTSWATQIARSVAAYERLFRAVGVSTAEAHQVAESSLGVIADWYPAVLCELEGIAAGSGVDLLQLMALNARTEMLALHPPNGPGECSTSIVVPTKGAPRTIQTWDWHDETSESGLVWQYSLRHGRSVKCFTEMGMLGKIGVNNAGLGIHFNILNHASDGGRPGVPIHLIARRILDDASTIEEAVDLARSASVSASTVISVVTFTGDVADAACIEICPEGVAVVRPDENGVLLHTNHFLAPRFVDGEATRDQGTTYLRLEHLREMTPALVASNSFSERAASMCGPAGGEAPVCYKPDMSVSFDQRWQTLLTVSLDVENFALRYSPNSPAELSDPLDF